VLLGGIDRQPDAIVLFRHSAADFGFGVADAVIDDRNEE